MSHPKNAKVQPLVDVPLTRRTTRVNGAIGRGLSDVAGAMSIRTFLTLVIAVMGVALLAVVGQRTVIEAERSAQARDAATLAEIGQSLLPALIASRIERGTVVICSMATGPADDDSWKRLAEQRPITDDMATRSIAALRAAMLPRGAVLAQQIAEAQAQLLALRPAIDAALRLPLVQRDPQALNRYRDLSEAYIVAITNARLEVEQATAQLDPDTGQLILLSRQATAARNYASQVTLQMEAVAAFNLPWRMENVIGAAEDHGRADFAWHGALETASWPGIPDTVRIAVAKAEAMLEGPEAQRQAAIIATLQSGKPSGVPVSGLQRLDTGLLMPINDVLKVTTGEIAAQAKRDARTSQIRLGVTVAMLLLILSLTGFGVAAVHQRVSGPIRRLTRQMTRLKDSDTGFAGEDEFELDAARRDEIGEMTRALVVFRRQVEEHGRRLQEHEMRQFLETLIDAMPVSITFKDTELRYRYVNRSRRAALGDSGNLVVGKRLSEVADADAAGLVEQTDHAVLTTGEPQQFEQTRSGADGKPAIILSLKTPFREADGAIRGIITCGVDITRLKHIEAELTAQREKAEAANRAKTAFLASMSHELRTPLNAIIGFADVLAQGYLGDLAARQQEYVGDIRSSGEHLLQLVNDLLDLSSLEIGREVLAITDCSFDNLAVAALNMVQPQADKAGIRLEFAATGIILRADARALTQVMVNLLGNAIKFSPRGGWIQLRAKRRAGTVRISVEDSGPGMTEAERRNALTATVAANPSGGDPYKTRPKGGAGLGLPISRRLIEQHGGTLEIESERGRGSTVHVVLPGA